MIRLLVFLAAVFTIHAQPLSYGVKAGSPVNDPAALSSPFSIRSQARWTGGPTVELHLPLRFSVEFDALYRSDRLNTTYPLNAGSTTNAYLVSASQETKTWDFPLLLKYRLTDGTVRPFVSGGAFWSRNSTTSATVYTCLGEIGSCRPPALAFDFAGGRFEHTRNRFGPVAGAGIDIKARYVTISPEVRYQYLGRPNQNQVTVLVGFTFGR